MPPLVSVRVATYNHEKYIAQCMEASSCSAPISIRVIVGEDCSTDHTREIVLKYQQKYPEKIKAILQPKISAGRATSCKFSRPARENILHLRGR